MFMIKKDFYKTYTTFVNLFFLNTVLQLYKARIDKLLNYWSEHVYSRELVDPLRLTLVQDVKTSRPRLPVVIPSNYAIETALQQQGWQSGETCFSCLMIGIGKRLRFTYKKAIFFPFAVAR